MNKPNDLTDYGYDFLTKIIETLLVNKEFFINSKPALKIEYFSNSSPHRFLIESMHNYFTQYNVCPTLQELISINNSKNQNPTIKEKCTNILDKIEVNIESGYEKEHYEYYINEIREFCKQKTYIEVFSKGIDLIKQNKFDEVDLLFHETNKEIDFDVTIEDYVETFEERQKDENRNAIPTGWSIIDETMQGGLGIGEICFWMGEIGVGKSWLLTQLAINALTHGFNVLHLSFENRKREVGLRYDSLISEIHKKYRKQNKEIIKNKIVEFFDHNKSKLFIQEFPNSGLTIPEMYSYIKRIQTKYNKKIHLLVVDYIDIVDLSIYPGDEWKQLKKGSEELRKLAFNLGLACHTATHPNAQGIEADIMEVKHVSGGTNRFKIVDFVFTFNRKGNIPTALLFNAKNRLDTYGGLYKMTFDLDIPKINVLGKTIQEEIPKEEVKKLKDWIDEINKGVNLN